MSEEDNTVTGGEEGSENTGATGNNENNDATLSGGEENSNDFIIPDEYKDKGWSKNIKNIDNLWKNYDNLQAVVGKKAINPDVSNMDDESYTKYKEGFALAEGESYDFSNGAEGYEPLESDVAFKEMLSGAGISKRQGDELIKSFKAYETAELEKQFDQEAVESQLTALLGSKENFEKTTDFIKNNLDDELREGFSTIPNQYLSPLYKFAASISDKYAIKTDNAAGGRSGDSSANTSEDRKVDLIKKIGSLGGKKDSHKQVNELREELNKLY